jgi:hypothetical protein
MSVNIIHFFTISWIESFFLVDKMSCSHIHSIFIDRSSPQMTMDMFHLS